MSSDGNFSNVDREENNFNCMFMPNDWIPYDDDGQQYYDAQYFDEANHSNMVETILPDGSDNKTNITTKPVKDQFSNLGLNDTLLLNIGTRDLNKLLRDKLRLPSEQISKIKRRRRVLKNCNSARSSRKKKNDKVKSLEDELRNHHQLSQKISDLRKIIREKNDLIRTLISWVASLYMRPNCA